MFFWSDYGCSGIRLGSYWIDNMDTLTAILSLFGMALVISLIFDLYLTAFIVYKILENGLV